MLRGRGGTTGFVNGLPPLLAEAFDVARAAAAAAVSSELESSWLAKNRFPGKIRVG